MNLVKAQGKLIVIGGGEDKTGDCRLLREFVKLAGGDKAKIVIITTATETPEETAAEYKNLFKRLGVEQARHVGVSLRSDAMKPESSEAVRQASGVFFTGGDQLHITSLMGGTELQQTILEYCRDNLIVAGTSAGAAMMGNSMIISGKSDENPRSGAVEIGPGTDIIIGCIIDTHFSQRGRHGRLLAAIAHFPQDLGLGIDENTAMIVDKNKFTVMGEGAVTVIDGSGMTHTDVPFVQRGESIALADVKIHVLSEGYKFDFKTRQPIVPGRMRHNAKTAGANENKKLERKSNKKEDSKKVV